MQSPPQVVNDPACAVSDQLRVERIAIHLVRLPLNEPFETSQGSIESRLIFLVSIEGEGPTGWGEVIAAEEPRFSYETDGAAQHVIRDYLAPAMLSPTARKGFRAGRD